MTSSMVGAIRYDEKYEGVFRLTKVIDGRVATRLLSLGVERDIKIPSKGPFYIRLAKGGEGDDARGMGVTICNSMFAKSTLSASFDRRQSNDDRMELPVLKEESGGFVKSQALAIDPTVKSFEHFLTSLLETARGFVVSLERGGDELVIRDPWDGTAIHATRREE